MKCDCCGAQYTNQIGWVYACWTLPGYSLSYYYCSERCKAEHRLQLIRGAGL